jgi:transcriptional regulatory protein RtcR
MPARRKLVVLGLLGTTLDAGRGRGRWDRWRPTVSLAQHDDLLVDRLELLHDRRGTEIAETVAADVVQASPSTQVVRHLLELRDAWDFEDVYGALHDFARAYPFDVEREDYLVHITTGTHVAQICLFLLTEARYFPARLLQTSPAGKQSAGKVTVIDLDLSRYDRIASRAQREKIESQSFLKNGIETRSAAFNALIDGIEQVALASRAPILLTGPTGAGKSRLARRIYELKKLRRRVGERRGSEVAGSFVEVNCATLRGDTAMSTLFGHKKGAFTGATADRAGLLARADQGVLFLDEIGELGLDEQAMLLRALEEKVFVPMGADREVTSDFQLLCGTNRDLVRQIAAGTFREDLHARINLWTFRLPALHERPEDLEPNLDFELAQASRTLGRQVTMSREARERFLRAARARTWPGNFRDFNAAVTRMATLATVSEGGRITEKGVERELERLAGNDVTTAAGERGGERHAEDEARLLEVLGAERAARLDRFDRVQLVDVLAVCARSPSLSAAGRELFAQSRADKSSVNDADRLRKYLAKLGIEFGALRRLGP